MIKYKKEILNLIIKEIVDNKYITQRELANKYYYTERTIRRYMKYLKDRNIIKLERNGNERYWLIK
jgi:DeoR/GlpR family transcriptional regulator of sugar metabolism